MIKFKKAWGTGFGSFIEETEFKFNRPGLNIIIAKNGSGKTTIFNLLNWICYGTTLKEIKTIATKPHLRPKNWKGTLGRLKFEKNGVKYEIIRCKDWKGKLLDGAKGGDRLLIFKGGKDISPRDKKDRQLVLNEIIGYTSELFRSTILFGQKLKRLTAQSGPEKKKVFDEAFESSFIKDSRKRAEKLEELTNAEFNDIDHELGTLKIKKEAKKESYNELKTQYLKQEKEQKVQIDRIKAKIKVSKVAIKEYNAAEYMTKDRRLIKAKAELASLSNIEKDIEDLEKREFRETNLLDDLEHQLGVQNNLREGFKLKRSSILTACPRCGQKLSPEKIQKEKDTLSKSFAEAGTEIHKLVVKIEDQKVIVQALLDQIRSKNKDKDNINSIKDKIRNLEREVKSLKYKDDSFKGAKSEIKELEAQLEFWQNKEIDINLKPYEIQIGKFNKQIKKIKPRWKVLRKELKNLKWAIKDVLGNTGLKAYIFDTMLKELNELLRYYEQFIGYRVEFNIDFDSANKDIYTLCYQGENDYFYEELSGAEGQLVDIVTCFALNDLVTRDRPVNIMVFDEVMDNLDEENIDIVNDLINAKALNTNIFLISHNIDLQSSSNKIIRLHKNKQGQTVMKLL